MEPERLHELMREFGLAFAGGSRVALSDDDILCESQMDIGTLEAFLQTLERTKTDLVAYFRRNDFEFTLAFIERRGRDSRSSRLTTGGYGNGNYPIQWIRLGVPSS